MSLRSVSEVVQSELEKLEVVVEFAGWPTQASRRKAEKTRTAESLALGEILDGGER